jgi:Transposase
MQKLTERRLAMDNVKSSRLDFTGQPIYIGLDVHKKSWSVSIFSKHGEYRTFNQPPEVDKLLHYLRHHFPGGDYRSVYEAGYCGFWIHDPLREQGVQCLVVNPADIPTKNKERRTKRDRIDCRKLGRSLRNGEIEGIYVPSRSKLEDRTLIRTRQKHDAKSSILSFVIPNLFRDVGFGFGIWFSQLALSAGFFAFNKGSPSLTANGFPDTIFEKDKKND